MPKKYEKDNTKPSGNITSRLEKVADSLLLNKRRMDIIETQLEDNKAQRLGLIDDMRYEALTYGAKKKGVSDDILSANGIRAKATLTDLEKSIVGLTQELDDCNRKKEQLKSELSTLLDQREPVPVKDQGKNAGAEDPHLVVVAEDPHLVVVAREPEADFVNRILPNPDFLLDPDLDSPNPKKGGIHPADEFDSPNPTKGGIYPADEFDSPNVDTPTNVKTPNTSREFRSQVKDLRSTAVDTEAKPEVEPERPSRPHKS